MKHVQCVNYINLDCEKGMCALSKQIVPIDGEGSGACPNFKAAPVCGNWRLLLRRGRPRHRHLHRF